MRCINLLFDTDVDIDTAADLRPSADGSAVRTSLVAKLQAASVPVAEAAAPWDRKTDVSRYSKMSPGRGRSKAMAHCRLRPRHPLHDELV